MAIKIDGDINQYIKLVGQSGETTNQLRLKYSKSLMSWTALP